MCHFECRLWAKTFDIATIRIEKYAMTAESLAEVNASRTRSKFVIYRVN